MMALPSLLVRVEELKAGRAGLKIIFALLLPNQEMLLSLCGASVLFALCLLRLVVCFRRFSAAFAASVTILLSFSST